MGLCQREIPKRSPASPSPVHSYYFTQVNPSTFELSLVFSVLFSFLGQTGIPSVQAAQPLLSQVWVLYSSCWGKLGNSHAEY